MLFQITILDLIAYLKFHMLFRPDLKSKVWTKLSSNV
jgi:hypothetical protein